MKNETIAFCIPGRTYSNYFLACWTATLMECFKIGINVEPPNWATGCNIYKIRNSCLRGDKEKGREQKPFQGKIKYDYLMWIDSDSVWQVSDFTYLYDIIKMRKDIHILSGVYRKLEFNNMDKSISTIISSDDDLRLLTTEELNVLPELSTVRGAGLGFCIMKYGVMESLDYPWFIPLPVLDKETKQLIDVCGDDQSLFIRLKEKGFDTWCATKVRIGHEKPCVYYME